MPFLQTLFNIVARRATKVAVVIASIILLALVGNNLKHRFDINYCIDGVQLRVKSVTECPIGDKDVELGGPREITDILLMRCANAGKDLHMVELESGRYFFSGSQTLNWYDALKFCNSRGLELISIENDQENDVVTVHSRSKSAGSKDKSHWLSGNNLGDPGRWFWMSTGEEMIQDEKRWHVGTLDRKNAGNNRCASIVNKSGLFKWQPQHCNDEKSFICEAPSFCSYLSSLQQQQQILPKAEIE